MREWLRQERQSKGMTQQSAADAAGMSQSYYALIETGERRPSPETAKKIAAILDIDWTLFCTVYRVLGLRASRRYDCRGGSRMEPPHAQRTPYAGAAAGDGRGAGVDR